MLREYEPKHRVNTGKEIVWCLLFSKGVFEAVLCESLWLSGGGEELLVGVLGSVPGREILRERGRGTTETQRVSATW